MPKFDFVGVYETHFPNVVTPHGTGLLCQVGDTGIELDEDPNSPLLVAQTETTKTPPKAADKTTTKTTEGS